MQRAILSLSGQLDFADYYQPVCILYLQRSQRGSSCIMRMEIPKEHAIQHVLRQMRAQTCTYIYAIYTQHMFPVRSQSERVSCSFSSSLSQDTSLAGVHGNIGVSETVSCIQARALNLEVSCNPLFLASHVTRFLDYHFLNCCYLNCCCFNCRYRYYVTCCVTLLLFRLL